MTRCYEGFDSCGVSLFNMAAWWSKAARCCRFHSLAYKLSVCDSSCWCVPRSATVPCVNTRISSASTTVASRCAMMMVVRFAIARFNAPRIFCKGDNTNCSPSFKRWTSCKPLLNDNLPVTSPAGGMITVIRLLWSTISSWMTLPSDNEILNSPRPLVITESVLHSTRGHCDATKKLWSLSEDDKCACREIQMMSHIVNDWPQTKYKLKSMHYPQLIN